MGDETVGLTFQHRCAAADGLLLQPVTSKERRAEGNAVRLAYGSSKITLAQDKVEDESRGSSVEAFGIVGRDR